MTEDEEREIHDATGELMLLRELLNVIEEGQLRGATQAEVIRQASLAMVALRVIDRADVHLRKALMQGQHDERAGESNPETGGADRREQCA